MRQLVIATLMAGAALPALARDISGEVTYLPRIALDPSAVLVVETSGPAGITGEARVDSEGRQVPLPFTLSTDDEGQQFLRAALLVGGVAEWVSQPVAVPAGGEPLDLGMITLERHVPLGFSSRLRCGDTVVDVGYANDEARLRVGGMTYVLPLAISASGARFSDEQEQETMVWTKGDIALVTIRGTELQDCAAVAMPASLPFTARGNEPGWALNLSADGMVLAQQDGSELRVDLPPVEETPAGSVLAADGIEVTITQAVCHDSMSGMPYPQVVTIRTDNAELSGCGGDPMSLLQGNWRAQMLGGATLPESAEVTLNFAAGSLSGKAACNRYTAGVTLSGEALTISPGALTMMACDEEMMQIEHEFVEILGNVTGFTFDAQSGALILTAAEQPVLVAGPDL